MTAMWLITAGCGTAAVSESKDVMVLSAEPDMWFWEDDPAPSEDILEENDAVFPMEGYDSTDGNGFGKPCKEGNDCPSEYCIPDPDGEGGICTRTCVEDCPEGYYCRKIPHFEPDDTWICVPDYPAPWCRPCRQKSDCADLWADEDLDCHQISPEEGSFCSLSCDDDDDCGQDFACRDGLCLPSGGCTCLEGPDPVGWETDCFTVDVDGQCSGVRVCLEDGLSDCSGKQPAPETCNGLDDDCDGDVDPEGSIGCATWWKDEDGDGSGSGITACLCEGLPGYSQASGDCDDEDPGVSPATPEICNGQDDDCDGETDEPSAVGCVNSWLDEDGDGWGGADNGCVCDPDVSLAVKGDDCDDQYKDVFPGATETCNGMDDDCDGETDDPSAVGCATAWLDEDGDGWGGSAEVCLCETTAPYVSQGGDCDDQQTGVNPAAAETCNGLDDDCDGETDEPSAAGCVTAWLDTDGDGFGGAQEACLCEPAAPWVTLTGDCDDTQADVNPVAAEACNGLDDDCDGATDDAGALGCLPAWLDGDGDGWGGPQEACVCAVTAPYAPQGGDCDDQQVSVNPASPEICNGLDDNCDGETDGASSVGCVSVWQDGDGDGWGGPVTACLCDPASPWVGLGGDCDDGEAETFPGAAEVCDGMDQDCDGEEGDVCDLDGDGWCEGAVPNDCVSGTQGYFICLILAEEQMQPWCPAGFGDCDDDDDDAFPGAEETCDLVDNDCDGSLDEGFDLDGDGWCAGEAGACCPMGGGDCNDSSSWFNPGVPDIPDSLLLDSNCDGLDGDINDAVFAAPAYGKDHMSGSMLFPKATIQAAIDEAATQGRSQVLVAEDEYTESLTMVEGVSVYGRYTTNGGWQRHAAGQHRAVVLSPDATAVNASGLGAITKLNGLEIEAADPGPGEGASIVVLADDSPGLSLRDLKLTTGNGGDGEAGTDGYCGGAGNSGEDGHNGCNSNGCLYGSTCSSANPFGAGYQFSCTSTSCTCGGTGQNWSTHVQPEEPGLPYPWVQGQSGQHSCRYRYNGPGKGGKGGNKGVIGHKSGYHGGNGDHGQDGAAGSTAPFGHVSGSGWVTGHGGAGSKGKHGYGGGGGGKGKYHYESNPFICDT